MPLRRIALVVLLLVISAALFGADDSIMGTWRLNPAKSKFSPGPPLVSEIVKYEPSGNNGIRYVNDLVDAVGEKRHLEFTGSFDGKDYPWTASPYADTISLERIDANTTVVTGKKAGKVTVTSRLVVSKDGKTMTITQKGKNSHGQAVSNVEVLEKQ